MLSALHCPAQALGMGLHFPMGTFPELLQVSVSSGYALWSKVLIPVICRQKQEGLSELPASLGHTEC